MAAAAVVNEQDSLDGMEATRIKISFTNMTSDSLETLPELEDVMYFLVKAECSARGVEKMKDGERRRTARMEVLELVQQGAPIKPDDGPSLFSIGDKGDDGTDGE